MEQIADKLGHDGASDVYKDVRVKDDIRRTAQHACGAK